MQMLLPIFDEQPRVGRARRGTWTGKTCLIEDCDRAVHSAGYCAKHLSRLQSTGDPLGLRDRFKYRLCSHPGCGRKHWGNGYCTKHLARVNRYGHSSIAGKKPVGSLFGVCQVVGCPGISKAKGLCNAHWLNLKRFGTPTPELRRQRGTGQIVCTVDGCGSAVDARDLCSVHYSRALRYGDPEHKVRPKRYAVTPVGMQCEMDGCTSKPKARGLCKRHYDSFLRNRAPLRYKIYNLKRRARLAIAYVYDYTDESVAARMAYWGNRCWMCGGPFECIDHVKPITRGGKDCPANFRPSCTSCNSAKHARWFGVSELSRFVRAEGVS